MTASLHALGSGASAGSYYTDDPNRETRPRSRDEYYSHDGGGIWWSSGESIVRHGAAIDRRTFRDLCEGLDPASGKPLVRGAGSNHRAGWDITFSMPKGMSLLWATGTPSQRETIETIQNESVDAALKFLVNEQLVHVRRGAGGCVRESAGDIIVARFNHFTSREGQPSLHQHSCLMNVALSSDGKHYFCLEPDKLYKFQRVLGAAYRTALGGHLISQGFSIRRVGRDQIDIDGIPEPLLAAFSKRSHQIVQRVGRNASAAQKEIAALATRGSKEMLPTGEALNAIWKSQIAAFGVDLWTAAYDARRIARHDEYRGVENEFDPPEIPGATPVARAASLLFRHENVLDRKALLEQSLIEASLQGVGIDAVYAEIAKLEASGRLLPLDRDRLVERWTTPAIAACEAAMLRAADRRRQNDWFNVASVDAALSAAPHLSEEQCRAVRHATSRDAITLIDSAAGSGKTTLAKAVVEAASGLRVIGLAPSWVAADELTKSTGIEAIAIARWRQALSTKTMAAPDERTLILVDEAGMVSTREMSFILETAKIGGAKIALFCDRRQLASVAGASAIRAVADILDRQCVISEVRRQRVDWQRVASTTMARGDTEAGLREYAAQDHIELVDGSDSARARTVALWQELRAKHGDDVLIVTRRNRDAAAINQLARSVLRTQRILLGDDVEVLATGRDNKICHLDLAVGDRIRFGETLSQFNIRNGSRGTVKKIMSDGTAHPRVTIRLEDGRIVEDTWPAFVRQTRYGAIAAPRVVHAIAGTVYAAQGRTVAATVLHLEGATDSREIYVGLTRHFNDARIVVEGARLDAACRMRQSDRRIAPTRFAMLERLYRESRRYHEKANVVDYVEDRSRFIETGSISLRTTDVRLNVARAVETAQRLQAAAFEIDERKWDWVRRLAVSMATSLPRVVPRSLQQLMDRLRTRIFNRVPERAPSLERGF